MLGTSQALQLPFRCECNWKQATPHFNETHLKAYVDFISTVFPPHIRKARALNYDASASSSMPSTPSTSQSLDSGCSQPDSPITTPPATTSFQSPPLVLSAPPASTEHYGLHDPYDSFFPNVGLQLSNRYNLQDISFTTKHAQWIYRLFHLEDTTCTALIPVFIKHFAPCTTVVPNHTIFVYPIGSIALTTFFATYSNPTIHVPVAPFSITPFPLPSTSLSGSPFPLLSYTKFYT
ncbi:hypothetical protein BDR04DRAFT_1163485 [Suillus decipiens]|nr:hypothetical protein BDR04DRAFT_1163485 [Suillus decipiens]